MDKAALFREFVASNSVSDIDYNSNWFSFMTVFYRSSFAYCFCTCGFEHEYLMYLSDTGKVNEEMFEKLVQSVIDGKCPHVDKASKHQLQETSVNGIYITAAKGNELAIKDHLDKFDTSVGGIFKLFPLDIAILKGKYCIANMYYKYMRLSYVRVDLGRPIPTVKILDDNPVRIFLETTTRIQICLHTQDVELLEMASVKLDFTPLFQALRNTFKQGLSFESRIFSNLVNYHPFLVDKYIASAIIYNRPDALERILKMTPQYNSTKFPESFTPMFQLGCMSHLRPFRKSSPLCPLPLSDKNYLCQVLNREACKKVLSDKGLWIHHVDVSTDLQISILLSRLRDFYDDGKEDIIGALKCIPRDQRALSSDLNNYLTLPHIRNDLFKTVINLGANVNYKDPFGETPIGKLLQIRSRYNGVMIREKVALLINENPDITLHQRVVHRGIKRDAESPARQINAVAVPYDMAVEYIADVKEHGLFGYDNEDTFALNFLGPFLMECGFPANRTDLQKLLFRYNEPPFNLHPAEVAYIQRYIETPRSLVVFCRDSLRKHFGGRKIHKFVEHTGCPQKIKDIILITQITRTKI